MRPRTFPAVLALALALLAAGAGACQAAPVLRLDAAADTTAPPGGSVEYFLDATDVGDQPTTGPLTLQISLPTGLSAESADPGSAWDCSATDFSLHPSLITCTLPETLEPRSHGEIVISARSLTVTAAVAAGGGTRTASFALYGDGSVTRADGSPCATVPPGEPCSTTVVPVRVTEAPPSFGVSAFDQQVTADQAGDPYTQAGGHPFAISTTIDLETHTDPDPLLGPTWPVEPPKDIFVDLPPGFLGYPTATAGSLCTQVELSNSEGINAKPLCPTGSQIGVAALRSGNGAVVGGPLPIFNLLPPPGVPARFGLNVFGTAVVLDGKLRSGGDYGLSVEARNIPQGLGLAATELTFWGVPADPAHDGERSCPGQLAPWGGGPTCGSEAPELAFLRDPTSCSGPRIATVQTDSWFHPGAEDAEGEPLAGDPDWHSAAFASHRPPGLPFPEEEWGAPEGDGGCADVPFEPSITVRSTSHEADSPTGLDVDLTMPQNSEPQAIDQADVKSARTTLPEGMTVNPAAAAGLVGCSEAQVGIDDGAPPSCPDASKIGIVEILSPQLPDPLLGSIYQATQFQNPGHALLGFYTVAAGDGVIVKLAASVERDPRTGRLTTVFDENPQLPFDHYRLHFDEGPRAPLVNPPTCGTATSRSVFTSWARPEEPLVREDSFQITTAPGGRPCPSGLVGRPFAPGFEAGLADPTAGATSPFVLRLTRQDGEQRLRGLSISTPPGLSAYLKGVPYCPETAIAAISPRPGSGAAELASPSCPAASRVGTVSAGTGVGPLPFYVDTGKVYLAGPYEGAPLSLVVVVPAVAGPFDLGSVVTRAAVDVDPADTRLTVASDPLPLLIEGIPLDLRDLRVDIDRPHFTVAPTGCDPMSVGATLLGSDGAQASPASRFQVGGCKALGFKPGLKLTLKGKTKRAGHPSVKAVVTYPTKGAYSNIASAQVSLPHSEFLDQGNLDKVCTQPELKSQSCPASSVYGHARAWTPLLEKPLEGPVYLGVGFGHKLPDLVAELDGQIRVLLHGKIDTDKEKGIRNTFEVVPDAPVSRFELTLKGGKRYGLLENSEDVCKKTQKAQVSFTAHDGAVLSLHPKIANSCAKSKGKKSGRHRRHH